MAPLSHAMEAQNVGPPAQVCIAAAAVLAATPVLSHKTHGNLLCLTHESEGKREREREKE